MAMRLASANTFRCCEQVAWVIGNRAASTLQAISSVAAMAWRKRKRVGSASALLSLITASGVIHSLPYIGILLYTIIMLICQGVGDEAPCASGAPSARPHGNLGAFQGASPQAPRPPRVCSRDCAAGDCFVPSGPGGLP